MRIYLLWLIIFLLSCFSIKDWFKPVPILILMMPLYGHPDFPSGVGGVQGLNPWNVLLMVVLINYFLQKNKDSSIWDMGNGVTFLLLSYVIIIMISSFRAMFDLQTLHYYGKMYSIGQIFSENLINCLKFILPAYLVFVGARTKSRRKLVLLAIIAAHLYIALVVIRGIPISAVTDERALTQIGLKILQKKFSWSKVNTAMLLAGGAWAILFSTPYLCNKHKRISAMLAPGLFVLTSFALALTGGRTGYAVWAALGILFSFNRWKKGLLLLPLVVMITFSILPSARDRFLEGISSKHGNLTVEDSYKVTSGRTEAWPIVINRIIQAPFLGYGALAMARTGAEEEVRLKLNIPEDERGFPHPHNAYLWLLLDTGIIGALPIWIFWIIAVRISLSLCGKAGSENDAIGVTCLATSLSLLMAGLGSQNFYPVHGEIALWAAIALVFRLHVDNQQKNKKHRITT